MNTIPRTVQRKPTWLLVRGASQQKEALSSLAPEKGTMSAPDAEWSWTKFFGTLAQESLQGVRTMGTYFGLLLLATTAVPIIEATTTMRRWGYGKGPVHRYLRRTSARLLNYYALGTLMLPSPSARWTSGLHVLLCSRLVESSRRLQESKDSSPTVNDGGASSQRPDSSSPITSPTSSSKT